ncbi:MAG: Arm DNA-binding domain-containing protein, partial [Nitrospirota bacterium]
MKGEITRQRIKNLHPMQSKEAWLWDSKISGFAVKVTAAGVKSYYFQYRLGGRGFPTRRLFLGRCDWTTPEQAREAAMAAKRAVFAGIDPFTEKQRELGKLFNDVAISWLDGYSAVKKKKKTHEEDQRLFERIIFPHFRNRYVSKITTEDIEALHTKLRTTPSQANRILGLVGIIFKYAIRHKHLPLHLNPC